MPRNVGSKPGDGARVYRCVEVAHQRGLLVERGTKAELARILGVTPAYVSIVLMKIRDREAEGSAMQMNERG